MDNTTLSGHVFSRKALGSLQKACGWKHHPALNRISEVHHQTKAGYAMKLGAYHAIRYDRQLPEALKTIADARLTGIKINSGAFLPMVYLPTFDDIPISATTRDDCPGSFEYSSASIAGLNCNGKPIHPIPVIRLAHTEDIRRRSA